MPGCWFRIPPRRSLGPHNGSTEGANISSNPYLPSLWVFKSFLTALNPPFFFFFLAFAGSTAAPPRGRFRFSRSNQISHRRPLAETFPCGIPPLFPFSVRFLCIFRTRQVRSHGVRSHQHSLNQPQEFLFSWPPAVFSGERQTPVPPFLSSRGTPLSAGRAF